jgi:hypothetical protein
MLPIIPDFEVGPRQFNLVDDEVGGSQLRATGGRDIMCEPQRCLSGRTKNLFCPKGQATAWPKKRRNQASAPKKHKK